MPAFRVMSPVAPLHREPRASSEQTSQYRFGHLLVSLDDHEGWVLGRGLDDYEGWMHQGYLSQAEDHAHTWRDASISLGCRIRLGERVLELPLGALVPRDAVVESGEVLGETERVRRFPPEANAIAASAATLFPGTAYVWGGTTPWGADCSGFVQTIYALHGIPVPRDSSQQADIGAPAGDDPLELAAADLLFFSDRADGHITHVAASLGGGRIAHCAMGRGGHRVEDLRTADGYVTALLGRFRFARRVVGA